MYSVEFETRTGVICVSILGLLSVDDVAAVMREVGALASHLRTIGKQHRLLYDYSVAPAQSQAVVQATQHLARSNPLRTPHTALVYRSALGRRQGERVGADGSHIQLFSDRSVALAWLESHNLDG